MDELNPQIFAAIQLSPRLLAQPQQTIPFLPEDIHICGNCKQSFTDIEAFLQHKNECNSFMSTATAALLETMMRNDATSADSELQPLSDAESLSNVTTTTLDSDTTLLQCANLSIADSRREMHIDEEDVASLLASQFAIEPVYLPSNDTTESNGVENKDGNAQAVDIDVNDDSETSLYFQEPIDCVGSSVNASNDVNATELTTDYSVEIEIISNEIDSNVGLPKEKDSVKEISVAMKKRRSAKMKPRSCDKCDFVTVYLSDLTRHKRKHTGEKPFSCTVCVQRFSRRDKLQEHLRIHTGYRPYKCQLCSYAGIDAACLRKHLRSHTDERPFKCQFCPYSAKDTSQLTVHLRRHTGDAPFVCSLCHRAFRTSTVLKRHNKIHKKTTQLPNELCNFKVGDNAIEKKDDTLQCDICEKFTALDKEELSEHKEKMHPVKNNQMNSSIIVEVVNKGSRRSSRKIRSSKANTDSVTAFPHECSFCVYQSKTQRGLKQHVCKQHPGAVVGVGGTKTKSRVRPRCLKLYHCFHCFVSFVREDSLRSHLKQHQNTISGTFTLSPKSNSNNQQDISLVESPTAETPESEAFIFENIECGYNMCI